MAPSTTSSAPAQRRRLTKPSSSVLPLWSVPTRRRVGDAGQYGWSPRRVVPRVGREAIRVMLLHHDLKLWQGKCGGAPG